MQVDLSLRERKVFDNSRCPNIRRRTNVLTEEAFPLAEREVYLHGTDFYISAFSTNLKISRDSRPRISPVKVGRSKYRVAMARLENDDCHPQVIP